MVLIFTFTFMTFGRYLLDIDDKKSQLKRVYMHENCKFPIFKFSKVVQ